MAKAIYKRGEIRTAMYTTGAEETVAVDDIVMMGVINGKKSTVGVARENIAAASTGIVATSGVFEFPKIAEAVIKAGEAVTWDDEEAGVEANIFVPEEDEIAVVEFGAAMHDAAATTTVIDVDITKPGVYTVGVGL